MNEHIYIDTNIFIDLLDVTRPSAKGTLVLIRQALESKKILYINSDTVTNAFYVLHKTKRYDQKILFELFRKMVSLFQVVPVENKEVFLALALCEEYGLEDYEDALQYVCAKKVEAEVIVTNDKKFISKDIEVERTC